MPPTRSAVNTQRVPDQVFCFMDERKWSSTMVFESDACRLPATPPVSAIVGPAAWARAFGAADTVPVYPGAHECLAGLSADRAVDTPLSLLLLDGDSLLRDAGPAERVELLISLHRARPSCLPILFYTELTTNDCVDLFQAGLFAAVPVPVTADRWQTVLTRVGQREELSRQRRFVREQSRETTQQLRSHRHDLQQRVDHLTDELLQTQQNLERKHRDLSEHMAQLSLLYTFGRELSSAANWDESLRGILENLSSFVGAAGSALILRSAIGGKYSPRQTFRWEESAWDKVLLNLQGQIENAVAERIVAPGVFCLDSRSDNETEAGRGTAAGADDPGDPDDRTDRRILALPLEHQGLRLGYLLLLGDAPADQGAKASGDRRVVAERFLPFLQAVQLVLAEEVASAQMLDRVREIGTFNARVLEKVRSGIWVFDELGRTIYCNKTGQALLTGTATDAAAEIDFTFAVGRGRDRDDSASAAGAPQAFAVPELFLDGRLQLDNVSGNCYRRLLDHGDTPFRGEGRIICGENETVPVLVQTSIMTGRGRDQRWLVMVVEDLRETRKLEAERIRADRLEGLVEMSATLAHEIRNPLMGLSAQAELLADQLPGDDQRKRYIDVITGEVQRINATINRLLNFVRPYEPERSTVVLFELARDCLDLAREQAATRSVALELRTTPPGEDLTRWRQRVDGGQIKQVLLNLLRNAVDASPSGGTVRVELARTARMELSHAARGTSQLVAGAVLDVSDAGPGFDAGDREKIFRPFYTTKSSGTGLGLSICRKIVAAHGGEIRAERQDQRTHFRVLIPQEQLVAENKQRQEVS